MVPDSGIGVGVLPPLELELAPLQAMRQATLSVAAIHRIPVAYQRRLLNRTKHKVIARVAIGVYPNGDGRWLVARALVTRVSVVEAAVLLDGVTDIGENPHDVPESESRQLNDTGELKPFSGVTVMVVTPLCPAVTVSDVGDTATEKSGGRLIV